MPKLKTRSENLSHPLSSQRLQVDDLKYIGVAVRGLAPYERLNMDIITDRTLNAVEAIPDKPEAFEGMGKGARARCELGPRGWWWGGWCSASTC